MDNSTTLRDPAAGKQDKPCMISSGVCSHFRLRRRAIQILSCHDVESVAYNKG